MTGGMVLTAGLAATWLIFGGLSAGYAAAASEGPGVASGQRLLQEHCQRCHGLEAVDRQKHSWLGWYWTVERMRWFHGARLPSSAQADIVDYLTRRDAAGWQLRLLDAGRLLVLPALIVGVAGTLAARALREKG